MSKMGLHDPFGYLKHKLWPKERPRIKLPIWLPTTKLWELLCFTCVQVVCYISLENSQQGIKLCFKSHLSRRSTQEVIGLQSHGSPNFKIFGTPNLGVLGQNDIWVLASWLPPSSNRGESCESVFVHGSSMHQKCSNYALTNLLFDLCRSMWIIDPLVTCPSLIPKLQHASLPLKCYEQGSIPQLLILPLFSP
jgi:hypothetical protein